MQDKDGNERFETTRRINYQPRQNNDSKSNKYALIFHKETEDELRLRKKMARQSLVSVAEKELEIDAQDYFPSELAFPKRPVWSYNLTKEQLDAKENRYFTVSNL